MSAFFEALTTDWCACYKSLSLLSLAYFYYKQHWDEYFVHTSLYTCAKIKSFSAGRTLACLYLYFTATVH